MNGDESMAFGSSFHAANKTKLFRVRPINFYDGAEYTTSMIINNLASEAPQYHRNSTLFARKENFDKYKSFNLNYDDNLNIDILV